MGTDTDDIRILYNKKDEYYLGIFVIFVIFFKTRRCHSTKICSILAKTDTISDACYVVYNDKLNIA